MATSAPVSDVDIPECPVCQDEYTDPKILPCNHIVCRKCVLSWLQKEGGAGSCPVCRAQILPNQNPDPAGQGQDQSKLGQGQGNLTCQGQIKVGQDQGNLAAVVDALPTDLALATFVESSQVLKGHRACAVCEESGVVATTYCLQCEFHLCQACTKTHKKYPAFRKHQVEVMASLTREQVASSRRFTCQVHRDKPAEIYCSAHKELVCVLCILTTHEQCPGKKSVQDVAKSEKESLAKRASALREKESALTKQINQIKETFKNRHLMVNNTFDDLQQELDKRRQELTQKVKSEEDDVSKNSLALLEQRRSAVTSQASSIEHHVTSSPDHALLMMMKDLTSRLDDVETTVKAPMKTACGGEVTFETGVLPRLKNAIQNLGSVGSDNVFTVTETLYPDCKPEQADANVPLVLESGEELNCETGNWVPRDYGVTKPDYHEVSEQEAYDCDRELLELCDSELGPLELCDSELGPVSQPQSHLKLEAEHGKPEPQSSSLLNWCNPYFSQRRSPIHK